MIPPDQPAAVSNRSLRCLGEMGDWHSPFPHPSQLLESRMPAEEREKIALYVEQSSFHDPFADSWQVPALIGAADHDIEMKLRTDGYFAFPAGLGYYIRLGVRLPNAFVKRVRKAAYQPAVVTHDFSDAPTDRSMYWLFWSLMHTRWRPVALLHAARMVAWLPIIGLLMIVRRWMFRGVSMKSAS